jgi:hypothetical protein
MRSMWTLGILVVLLGLHAASLNLPWYTYTHSTGRTLPPEFPSNETGENITQRAYYPFALRGDVNATMVEEAADQTRVLGIGVSATIGLMLLAFAIELIWGQLEWARWPGMVLTVAAILVTLAMLLFVFFQIPTSLHDEGVRGAFTNRQVPDGFVRSTLGWGWVVAALGILAHFAHFAFRYQQGSFDLSFVERFRSRPR